MHAMKNKLFLSSFCLFILTSFLIPKKALAAVTFSLNPVSKTVSVNDTFDVSIVLDTAGQKISGGSAVLVYDPAKLQVVDANAGLVGVQVTPGSIFTTATTNSVDAVSGKITLDYGKTAGSFSSSGNFGSISFKAVAAGATSVSFVLGASGTSTSSAVYAAGANVLAAANSGSYTISSSVSSGSSTITPTPSKTLPQTGAVENTMVLLAAGILFIFCGLFFFSKSRI